MAMHAPPNIGKAGDTVIFFVLSGTGKMTLSADPKRELVGDDEHGLEQRGVFNIEGGCYDNSIDLIEEDEPDIFNVMMENVWIDANNEQDYSNSSKRENGRVSYRSTSCHFRASAWTRC